jgi:hypothetical protein
MNLEQHKYQYINLIIRSILVFYVTWIFVLVADLTHCVVTSKPSCESQRSELRGAASLIPATLLAWLADSPVQMK